MAHVPVGTSVDRCEHRDGPTGATEWDCGRACRTVAGAGAQSKLGLRCSWIVRSLWWANMVTSDLPSTAVDRVWRSVLDPGVTTTKTRVHRGFFSSGGSEGEGRRRLGGHAQVERTLCIRHGYPGVIIAALVARVREDLTTLPEESGSWERHAEEYLLHHCCHLRSLRGVIVMVIGDLDEGRIGGFDRQHTLLCQTHGMLESAARLRRPTRRPLAALRSSRSHLMHREASNSRLQGSNTGNWPLLGLSQPGARPDVPVMRQANQVRQQGQWSKSAKGEGDGANSDGVVIFMILAQLVLAIVHGI